MEFYEAADKICNPIKQGVCSFFNVVSGGYRLDARGINNECGSEADKIQEKFGYSGGIATSVSLGVLALATDIDPTVLACGAPVLWMSIINA